MAANHASAPIGRQTPAPSPNNKRISPVTRHSSPIDHRPFQPKAKLENQQALVSRYGAIAIAEVAEALFHLKPVATVPGIAARAA